MRDPSIDKQQVLESKLDLIENLITDKSYKEALAEIRDLETTHCIESCLFVPFRLYYLKAFVLRFLGSYQEALENAQMAFSLTKTTNETNKIAQVHYILGLIYLSLGDLRLAEIEIRDAQTSYRRESDLSGVINTLNQLAYIESIRGDYSKSVELLYDALRYCDQVNIERYKTILHGELGDRFLMMGKWDKAEENLLINIDLNEKAKDEINLCRGLLSLGYVYFLKREFEKSRRTYQRSLALIEGNGCVRELAIYHEFFGELESVQNNYGAAQKHYDEAIRIAQKIAPESGIISQTYRLLADLQIAQKQYNKALFSCERALKVAQSLGERVEIGAIHRALGQIYTVRQDKGKVQEHFRKAISILEEIGAKFELGKAYLEALKSNSFEYHDRVAFFARSREVFKELESDYWLGKAGLVFCDLLFENDEYEEAKIYLREPEGIFKRLKEEKELAFVLELKSKIEEAFGKGDLSKTSHQKRCHFSDIVTQDPQMLVLIDEARRFKDSDLPILLEGETGTGKDLMAIAIHYESKRKNKSFVKVNCAAIPESLLEGELFGYKKGAFTGANEDKKGYFEEADGGTIFLNEIGELPLRLQAKILDVIEDKCITRLGEVVPRRVDFRVITATNKNLDIEVGKGNFRQDLYHRLNVLKLKLPPLRERKKDVPLLIRHFLAEQGIENPDVDGWNYSPDRWVCNWPGNVRQLKNEIKRMVSILNPFDKDKLLEELSKLNGAKTEDIIENSMFGKKAEAEKTEILEAIKKCNGDKEKAAKLLDVSRATLYRKLKDYNLEI